MVAEASNTLAKRFRVYRVAAGYNQTELARVMGKHASGIASIEAGLRNPKTAFLAQAARLLHCDISDFLESPGKVNNITLIRSPDPDILVGRTCFDAENLAKFGHKIGLPMAQIDRLFADTADRCGVSIRRDLPAAGPVPIEGDGLGPEYRRRIYTWAQDCMGEGFTETQRELFRRVEIEGEESDAASADLGLAPGNSNNSSARQMIWNCYHIYNPLISGPIGVQMARKIVRDIILGSQDDA